MYDLIWVGNTLLPRWFVFGGAGMVALLIIGSFVVLTDWQRGDY